MKKIITVIPLLIILSCHYSQNNENLSQISVLPALKILLLDSSTIFNTNEIHSGKPVVMVYFRPDCPHCQAETKDLITNISRLKEFNLYFLAGADFSDIKGYSHYFHLDQYPNITVGKDYQRSFIKLFKPRSIPYMAIYDSQKQLVKIFHGEVPINTLIASVHG